MIDHSGTLASTNGHRRWRSTALNAKSVDEITPFWTAEMKDEFNMEPDSAKAGTLDMVKRVVSSVDIVMENGAWKMTGAVELWKPKGN